MPEYSYNYIKVEELDKGILKVVFNRPEVYNAFNEELSKEFIDFLYKSGKDDNVKSLIIRGVGDKAFNSGQDIKEILSWGNTLKDVVSERYNPIAKLLYDYPKPIIGALNGIAAGAGAGVALACDYIVAAEHSSMLFAFINIGLCPDTGVSYILPKIVGVKKAFELLTRGEIITAQELLKLKMINEIVPYEDLDKRAFEVAKEYSEKPLVALMLIKRAVYDNVCERLETALHVEELSQKLASNTQDFQEGIKAFIEKRKPKFRGK